MHFYQDFAKYLSANLINKVKESGTAGVIRTMLLADAGEYPPASGKNRGTPSDRRWRYIQDFFGNFSLLAAIDYWRVESAATGAYRA